MCRGGDAAAASDLERKGPRWGASKMAVSRSAVCPTTVRPAGTKTEEFAARPFCQPHPFCEVGSEWPTAPRCGYCRPPRKKLEVDSKKGLKCCPPRKIMEVDSTTRYNQDKVSLPVIVETGSSAHRCGEQHSPGGSPRGGRHLSTLRSFAPLRMTVLGEVCILGRHLAHPM